MMSAAMTRTGTRIAMRLRPSDAESSTVEMTVGSGSGIDDVPRTTPTHGLSAVQVDSSAFSAAEVAATISPPMLGRMKVWTASLIVSTAGIL